jgi:hypothetical protein
VSGLVYAGLFLLGLALLVAGTVMLRALARDNTHGAWMRLVDDRIDASDPSMREHFVERLAILRNDWSRSVLEEAKRTETDPRVREAIERALNG